MNMLILAVIVMVVGIIPGLFLFPALASPFVPAGLWILSTPFAKVFHTIAQVIRGAGVLVKRKSGVYETGIYDADREQVYLGDRWLDVDTDRLRWALFGKRRFGVTWEEGTDFHDRIRRDADGTEGVAVNMGAAHRFLRGTNDADAITRTEEASKANYGGGDEELSFLVMAALLLFSAMLGSFTSYVML